MVLSCHSAGARSRDKRLSYRVILVRSDIETLSEYEPILFQLIIFGTRMLVETRDKSGMAPADC
jgi:hypothetical protein